MHEYEVQLTPLALGFAKAKSSVESVVARTRAEVAVMLTEGLTAPLELIFHSFEEGGVDYIIFPHPHNDVMMVDTCTFEDMNDGKPLEKGPLKGKPISMATSDTFGDLPMPTPPERDNEQ